jgi:hypothetical protein
MAADQKEVVTAAIAKIVEGREQASESVVEIKRKFKPGDMEYDEGRRLYITALAKHNSWIATMKVAIEKGKTKNLAKDQAYQSVAAQADQAAQDFIRYAETKCGVPRTRGLPILALAELGMDIWNAITGRKQRQRMEEAAQFERNTVWSRWEAIQPGEAR